MVSTDYMVWLIYKNGLATKGLTPINIQNLYISKMKNKGSRPDL